ncbi:MAG: S8 family serine peptidase, partial [Actinobacteria bacterium]|nr:S8 family serine peptidase [Actinomycetota bacterium]
GYYELLYNDGLSSSDKYLDGSAWIYTFTYGWLEDTVSDFYFRTNPNGNPRDDNGHGTHCAGIAAAVTNNGVGVAGTCPAAKVLPIKVLNAAGSGSSDAIANGIYYAADKGAEIISMSIQGPAKSNAAQEACTYAYNKGCTLFAAAGNTGDSTMNYPAGYDHTIGVGATTNKDEKADFSTYNKSVDLSAPGKDIYSTLPTYPVTFNAQGHSKNYDYLDGTSMACPMAAGVGALLKARSPTMSPAEIEESLESTADDLGTEGRDDKFGYGRVNAARAMGGGPQYTWYLAEGTTAWGFSTYITIENPNSCGVTVDVTYMPTGAAPVEEAMSLPANSQTTLTNDHIRGILGEVDFSTKVECDEGETIAVDRTMSWGDTSGDGHCSIGVTSPSNIWYLPEGSSAWGFECWLLIQNPNSSDATATVTYMIEGEGPQVFQKNVPASSRATYNMEQDIGNKDASIKVESNAPVIPERAMYRNSRAEGHDSIGTTSPAADYYLAEGTTAWGFTTYVLIQNPQGTENQVNVTYMTPSGEQSHPENPITMPANSRKTIRVNDFVPNTDLSTRVTGNNPIIAERAMYWDGPSGERCHDSIGMAFPHTTFYLPDGETSNGRETWTLVQNPNSSGVEVRITYLTPDGQGNVTFTENIPANSRSTFSMADRGINGRAAVLVTCTTSGKKIMVERAMYWNNRGAGTDTIGGYSD